MDDQFLYAELIPSIILIIIALASAEFIGRSKHIGFGYTFFMMLGIIPGIIGLITSPSAKEEPIKSSKSQDYLAIVFFILGLLYIAINSINGISFAEILIGISIFSTGNYFYKLNQGEVYNENPKFYFGKNEGFKGETKPLSKLDSLINLKEKGILSEDEYNEKTKIVNQEIKEKRLKETEEYKQLESLLNSQLLTREEFENKVNILKEKI